MNSPSPSQLTSFSTSLYGPATGNLGSMVSSIASSMSVAGTTGGNLAALQQRSLSNAPFQRTVTPTSLGNPMGPPPVAPSSFGSQSSISAGSSVVGPAFPLNLQPPGPPQSSQQQQRQPPQPGSPNSRNLFSLSQRGMFGMQPQQPSAINSQLKRSNPPATGLFGSGGNSISMAGFGFNAVGENQASLDLSEFPTLGNRSSASSSNLSGASRSYVGMVNKQVQDPQPEFSIQQEDFPALPGAQNPPVSGSDSARKTPTSSASYDMALKDRFPGDKSSSGTQKRGIQTQPDGTVSNIPPGMVTDQFGLVGLLTFMRAAETDPNLVALTSGIDLTTLGLNLNSPENLYKTFQSPWADTQCRPQDIDYHVPSEYLTSLYIRDKLARIKLNRYQDDLLFFLFYLNGGDVLQLAAAAELYTRDWRYHKEERVWITRVQGEPVLKSVRYEQGTYYFFDVQNWKKIIVKEFHLEYDKLEERPQLPPEMMQQMMAYQKNP